MARPTSANLVCSTRSLVRDQSNLDFARRLRASGSSALLSIALYNSIKLEVAALRLSSTAVTCTDSSPRDSPSRAAGTRPHRRKCDSQKEKSESFFESLQVTLFCIGSLLLQPARAKINENQRQSNLFSSLVFKLTKLKNTFKAKTFLNFCLISAR